ASQAKTSSFLDAIETFRSSLPLLPQSYDNSSSSPERRIWTECLVSHFCLLSSELATSSGSQVSYESALEAFRAWAKFWESRPGQGLAALTGTCMETGSQTGIPRRHVWKSYYVTLSKILQNGLPYPPPVAAETSSYGPAEHTNTRLQQRAEVQRVQSTYEIIMLEEVRFPKADEFNEEVEEWVETVIRNWGIFCGGTWQDDDLGEGGKEAVARNVLEILYRAAAKSFHSTLILRHLFTVHASLAEFNLAVKALDTYLELVTKAKARVEKSGESEAMLDDDETILRTVNEGIRMLCRFGGRSGVEKARQLGVFIESWLKEYNTESQTHPEVEGDLGATRAKEELGLKSKVSPEGVATANRAIGISQSHWARLTFDASSRAEIQACAAKHLSRSLASEYGDASNLESLFALGLLLAESRDINGAIEVVKRALLPPTDAGTVASKNSGTLEDNSSSPGDGRFIRERSLIPFWHLLALLLSARQDFATAVKSCEAAFEQFLDPVNLFGRGDPNVAFSNDKWLVLDDKSSRKRARGIVDDIDNFEREGILQIKMTQLALVEVAEGPEIAVNASDELLGLYQRLFGDLRVPRPKVPAMDTTPSPPPKSSSGTIRSFGGGLFSRQRSVRKNIFTEIDPYSTTTPDTLSTTRPQTTAGQTPRIRVTDEDGGTKGQGHQHTSLHSAHHEKSHTEKLHKRHKSLTSLRKKKIERPPSAGSPESKSKIGDIIKRQSIKGRKENQQPQTLESEQFQSQSNTQEAESTISPSPSQVGLAVSPDIPSATPSITTELSSHQPIPRESSQSELPEATHSPPHLNQDAHSSIPKSLPQRYPILRRDDQRRRSVRMLIKVWLLIAGLYRRAAMYEDAKESVDEAAKLIDQLDSEMSKDVSNGRAFGELGWEGGKTAEELRGDVWAEASPRYLSQAQSSHYEALSHFEQAVSYFPDHPLATVGLANILLDISSQAIQPPPYMPSLTPPSSTPIMSPTAATPTQDPSSAQNSIRSAKPPLGIPNNLPDTPNPSNAETNRQHSLKPQAELDLLAARDRAYGLLSSLTKLGSGWDFSEAWMALARAYEDRGQIERAGEALWWCVELEEGRPVRAWSVVNAGGFVL
ncbi:hypothetical protein GP486_006787, partial [Trichoglossum hirsutum]